MAEFFRMVIIQDMKWGLTAESHLLQEVPPMPPHPQTRDEGIKYHRNHNRQG